MLGMAEYQETEKKYYQLWFPSVNILNQQLFDIVNSTLLSRSKIRYDDILKEKDIFVETEIFKKTILKAQKNRVVIISGEPGVGKTTLAGQVALFYMGKYHSKSFIDAFSVQDPVHSIDNSWEESYFIQMISGEAMDWMSSKPQIPQEN